MQAAVGTRPWGKAWRGSSGAWQGKRTGCGIAVPTAGHAGRWAKHPPALTGENADSRYLTPTQQWCTLSG